MESALGAILELLDLLGGVIEDRSRAIEEVHGPADALAGFDLAVQHFEQLLRIKEDMGRREGSAQASGELEKVAHWYETVIEELGRSKEVEEALTLKMEEATRSDLKASLLERLFFQEGGMDRAKLAETLARCRAYRQVAEYAQAERGKLARESGKLEEMKGYFVPRVRALATEEARKEELLKELAAIVREQEELEEVERRVKRADVELSRHAFQRSLLEKEMDECAAKGNVAQFKAKQQALAELEREMLQPRREPSTEEFARAQAKMARDAVALHAKYADIVKDILNDHAELGYLAFITLLAKRLSLA